MKLGVRTVMVISFLAVISQCGRGPKYAAGAGDSADKPALFVPPSDSTVSAQQMAAWFSCNSELDSLSGIFTKSLPAGAPALTDSLQYVFSKAQDRLCRKNGLKGGYQEYRWILEHLGSSKNKALYDSLLTR
jgi:hypothetical protein